MKKTFSQKAAGVLTFAGYLTLIPKMLVLLVLACYLLISIFTFSTFLFLFTLIPLAIGIFSIFLLVGYHKQANETLSEGKILPLWIGTIIYKGLFLVPSVILLYRMSDDERNSFLHISSGQQTTLVILSLLTFWWIFTVSLAITAIISELSVNQKYR